MTEYKSKFSEDFDEEITADYEDLILEIEELDTKISEFRSDKLTAEQCDELKSALEGLKHSVDRELEML